MLPPAAGSITQLFHLIFMEPGNRTLAHPSITYHFSKRIESSLILSATGLGKSHVPTLVNFVPAVSYCFCLNLPAAFSQLGNGNLPHPCTKKSSYSKLPFESILTVIHAVEGGDAAEVPELLVVVLVGRADLGKVIPRPRLLGERPCCRIIELS